VKTLNSHKNITLLQKYRGRPQIPRVTKFISPMYKWAEDYDRLRANYRNLRWQVKQLGRAIDRRNNRIRNLERQLAAALKANVNAPGECSER